MFSPNWARASSRRSGLSMETVNAPIMPRAHGSCETERFRYTICCFATSCSLARP